MSLSPSSGLPVLKKPTTQEVDRLEEMYHQCCIVEPDAFTRFACQLCAAYLPSLIRTLLIMPMSVEGDSGTWWGLHVAFLAAIFRPKTSEYLARFVREKDAEALKLYAFALESLGGLGLLRPDILEARLPTIRNLFHLWRNLFEQIPQQLPSLADLPQPRRQTLEGLVKLRLALPVGRDETFFTAEARETLQDFISILLGSPERYYQG